MSRFSVITKPTTDLVMKLYRGIHGKDMKPEERRVPAISASDRQSDAQQWAQSADRPNEDELGFSDGIPHVWELEAQPRRPVTFDDRFVTLDQLNSKFDLTPMEQASLWARYAEVENDSPEYDINYLLKDPDFVDMLRQREIDIVISPERLPYYQTESGSRMPDNAVSTAQSYHILDDNIITNRRRVGKYMVDDLGFYSPARRVVEIAEQDKGDAGYWKMVLGGLSKSNYEKSNEVYRPKNGISPKKDADDIRLFDWLDSVKGPIRREDVLNYIDDHRIDISQSAYRGIADDLELEDFRWSDWEADDSDYMLDIINHRRDDIVDEVSGGEEFYTDRFHKWMSDTNRHMSEERALEIGAEESAIGDTKFFYEGQDLHDFAEEVAQEDYYDDPIMYTREDSTGYEIFGNEGYGFHIYDSHGGRIEEIDTTWRMDDALRRAQAHAIENQAFEFTDAEEGGGAKWLDWTLSEQARTPGEAPVNLVIEWDNYPDTSARPGFKNDHHFPPDHYVAHSRGEHRYVDGAWSFHIDEIQSDWHHQGADSGYIDPEGKRVFIGYHDDTDWILRDPQGRVVKDKRIYTSPVNKDDYYTEPQGSGMGTKQELIDYVNRISGSSPLEDNALIVGDDVEIVEVSKIKDNPVAPAPFVSNWHEVMFKRSVYDALINAPRGTGSEQINRITWTTGQTQARRYGRYAFHKEVHIEKVDDYRGTLKGEDVYRIATRTHSNKFDDGEFAKTTEIPKTIAEIKEDWGPAIAKLAETVEGTEMFTDVESGIAKGMSDIYDQKIPQFAKKWLKRYGVQIKKTRIEGKNFEVTEHLGKYRVHYSDPTGTRFAEPRDFDNERQLKNYMEAAGNIEVWYFDITPEMREDILENGIPLTMSDDEDDERMVA